MLNEVSPGIEGLSLSDCEDYWWVMVFQVTERGLLLYVVSSLMQLLHHCITIPSLWDLQSVHAPAGLATVHTFAAACSWCSAKHVGPRATRHNNDAFIVVPKVRGQLPHNDCAETLACNWTP